ncbi:MAG TPA: hypothetical protein PKK26_09400 [Candidatus Wallbacteria bacterium]|nr:hypothetical protein [Candidatus Wallbacteria bacterium]
MRTRKASLIEKMSIYAAIAVCLVAIGGIYFKMNSDFVVKRDEAEKKYQETQTKLEEMRRTESEKAAKRDQLRKDVERKKKEDELKQKEFEATLDILNRTLVNLPPIEVWPELIKKVEVLATDLKITITSFTIIENKDLKSNIKKDFTEFYFTLDIEGEYSKVLEYIWTLENSIQLKKEEGNAVWKAIIKVVEGGFSIKSLMTTNDTMKLQLTLTTFFRGGQ